MIVFLVLLINQIDIEGSYSNKLHTVCTSALHMLRRKGTYTCGRALQRRLCERFGTYPKSQFSQDGDY